MASPAPVPSAAHPNVNPSEVGWQFVPQYYTYMNKQPNRLHCFYTKNSTFIHGTEGEDVKPCYGQHEIHNKILSIGFTDCKVFINSVDAQSSVGGGIIIQVIGEMSNNAEAWRKFAQTFFLAEQPNGYFVLNDIFRYLKEEAVDTEEFDGETAVPAPEEAAPFTAPTAVAEAAPETVVAESVTTQPTIVEPEPEQPKVNGISHVEPTPAEPEPQPAAEPAAAEPVREPTPVPEEEPAPVEVPAPQEPAETPAAPAPAPAAQPAPVAQPAAAAPPPQPQAPPAPKTWANLAAANSNKWGNAVAQEAKGVSAAAAAAASPVASGATTPSKDGRTTPARAAKGDRESHSPAYNAAMSVNTAQCFVKGVTEVVSHQSLSQTLGARFGPIKEMEIVRSKACAFIEFEKVDSARRAIAASLLPNQGGEGGIRVDVGEATPAKINVETRKDRAERPNPRQRTGPTGAGEQQQQRGGFRGRGGPGGRGRGAAPVSAGNQK